MCRRTFCVAAAIWSMAVPSAAQVVLTEAEALARLSAESPRVRSIQAGLETARAEALDAARWPNPRLTYDRESVAGVTEGMTTVMQALPITGRRSLEVKAANTLVEAAASRAGDEGRRARADLRLAFTALASAQVREEELTRARDRLRALSVTLEKREAAGEAAGFDHLRALREVSDVEADLGAAVADRARAQAQLATLISVVDPFSIRVSPAIKRTELPDLDDLEATALKVRGEWLALDREQEAARLQEEAADRRLIPEPEVVFGIKTSSVGGDAGGVFAVQFSVPLFDRSNPERTLARAHRMQAQARADELRVMLHAHLLTLRTITVERRAQAESYRVSASASAEQIERIASVSYEAGERGILELLDAYRVRTTSRIRQATLEAAAREAEIELEFVSGWEIP